MLHAHVQPFLKTLSFDVFASDFVDFDLPNSILKFINAEMTQKSASEASAQNCENYLT